MKRVLWVAIPLFLLFFDIADTGASPKVTQAVLCDFKTEATTALAVEEFGQPPKLIFVGRENKLIYSTAFGERFPDNVFSYVAPFVRFRSYRLGGLPEPLIVAVMVSPGGSDVGYEIKLIGEKNGRIGTLTPEPISLSIQDGIYLGYINKKHGTGMIVWRHMWENEAHYDAHRYTIGIYRWDRKGMGFRLVSTLSTKRKVKNGCTALRSYRLPCKNFRDEIVPVEQDISTLGIEDALLPKEEKNEKRP